MYKSVQKGSFTHGWTGRSEITELLYLKYLLPTAESPLLRNWQMT